MHSADDEKERNSIALLYAGSYSCYCSIFSILLLCAVESFQGTTGRQVNFLILGALIIYPLSWFLSYCADRKNNKLWNVNSSSLPLLRVESPYKSTQIIRLLLDLFGVLCLICLFVVGITKIFEGFIMGLLLMNYLIYFTILRLITAFSHPA